MPAKGQFVLRPMANPPLKAGDYTLAGQVSLQRRISDPAHPSQPGTLQSLGDVERRDTHIRVTSPRYRLPPDQMLSAFPPANSVGAYENRLPQIVLKRRTLPWEREPAPGDTTTPWLALVVVAEGEATLSGEQPVAQCVTPGLTLTGPSDVATGVCLSVTEDVVNKVFPKKEELPLLCHVREVDVNDTELANGDDDGFLAVVIANRLPQYDRTNDKPVRYIAALINVEGQLDKLAKPPPPVFNFVATTAVFDYRSLALGGNDPDRLVMGAAKPVAPVVAAPRSRALPASAAAAREVGAKAAKSSAPTAGAQSAGAKGQAAQWQTTTARIEKVALTASQNEAGRLVRDGMLDGYRGNLGQLLPGLRVLRFPVLAHWSFTVNGSGGFESLMLDLQVDLLGTDPSLPVPEPSAPVKPPSNEPPTRPPVEVGPAGHVNLPHLTRHGDRVRAWFRGPLTPFPTVREKPNAQGELTLAHVSDQLRRSVPDGREDLSLAAAFEIGRLLALSQPSVVRGLLAWRGEQFGAARARTLIDTLKDSAALKRVLGTVSGSLADLLSRHLVMSAAANTAKVLAPTRPLVVPGRALPYAKEGGLDRLISEGFGFSAEQVKTLRTGTGTVAALKRTAVPLARTAQDAPVLKGAEVDRLRATLGGAVDRITAGAVGRVGGVVGLTDLQVAPRGRAAKSAKASKASPREPDALDDLLARATSAAKPPRKPSR